jgi:tetratricopeptide (TPR) repeat protein
VSPNLLISIIAVFISAGDSVAARTSSVAVLPIRDSSGNPDHWQKTVAELLGKALEQSKPVSIVPESSLDYAYRVLNYDRKREINFEIAREFSEVLDAQFAVWGRFERDGRQWRLSVEVLNVKAAGNPRQLTASSTNWPGAIYEIGLGILSQIGTSITPELKDRLNRSLGSSQEAVELVSRAQEDIEERRPISAAIGKLRSALLIDAQFDTALRRLIRGLVFQGEDEEALQLAQNWVAKHPNDASAHSSLGDVYLSRGQNALAVEQFQKSVQLNPLQSENYLKLCEIKMQSNEWAEAISLLERANTMAPYDPLAHAYLGEAYAHQGKVARALSELRLAESYDEGGEPVVQQKIGHAYQLLNEPVKAIAFYEGFLSSIDQYGVKVSVDDIKERLASLKSRLKPHFVKVTVPTDVGLEQIRNEAKDRLSAKQLAVITDPLERTIDMENWVKQTVGDARDDLEKAKRLFIGLSRKVNLRSATQFPLSAKQAFDAWFDPTVALTCQDYALLYITLARFAGLKAYYVDISRDYQDRPVLHACAGVFIGEEALLVDPAYQWFGAPHKSYQFQDDQNLVATWLAQSGDSTKEDAGLKLCQNWAAPFYIVVLNRVTRGEGKSATTYLYLRRGLKIDSMGWLALLAQGSMDWSDQKWDGATQKLSEGLETYSQWSHARYLLATALASQGKFSEAQAQFRIYLNDVSDPLMSSNVRDWIKRIDELTASTAKEKVR